jgi:hypothetical protein
MDNQDAHSGDEDGTAHVDELSQPDQGIGEGWHHMTLHGRRGKQWYQS